MESATFQKCTEKGALEQKGAHKEFEEIVNDCIRKYQPNDANPREYFEFLQIVFHYLKNNINQVQDMRKQVALMALNHAKCYGPDSAIRRQQYEEMLKKYCN